ncbi:hypothetical protein F4802DRAFT_584187 [Xylaria palmicola]|nr:hypothetical protein F4802DRAFT_584187 [Xylaria palmicola]
MDARPYRPNRHLPSIRDENHILPTGKSLHHRHKSTGNLLNMSTTGNLIAAAKRTALGDRNAVVRDAGDAPRNSKPENTQKDSTSSRTTAPKTQENRIQDGTKNSFTKAFFQPPQRPPKSIVPSISMKNIRPASETAHAHSLRKALSRSSLSTWVYSDHSGPREEKPDPAPAAPVRLARAALETRPVAQNAEVRPSTANPNTKQALLIDLTSPESEIAPREQRKSPDEQPSAHYSSHDEVRRLTSTYSRMQPLLPLPPAPSDRPLTNSPRTDADITESLYVDASESLAHEHIQCSVNAPVQFVDAPQPQQLAIQSLPEPLVPEHPNSSQTSGAQPEFSATDLDSYPYPPTFLEDRADLPYLSDCEEEDNHYDDRGYTTAHSYPSRGDNTTGGMTTVMFPPKISKKGHAEIEAARRFVESRRTPEDIQEDAWDVSMVAEYGDDIFRYMKEQEMTLLPNPHYMDNQGEIQWSMRSVLMDWVVQVHTRFGLLPETLFLTVNYIDRFLTHKIVSLGKLQLVGATAIFIAAKYEEINCPSVQEIVYMVDGAYTVEEILKAERFMLSMLDFELGWPGPMSFLRRISKADDYDLEARTLAKYFLEVVIMDERFVASPPSYIAAGAHCLSRLILHKGDWTLAHVHYSGYTRDQLKPLVTMLLDCCRHARKHHSAVFEKYSDKRYRHASTYVEEELMRGYTLPFEPRISMPFSVEFFSNETNHASYAGSHAMKMPIPTHG